MRSRLLVSLVLLVMLIGPLSTAFPIDDDYGGQEAGANDPIFIHLLAGTFDPLVDDGPGPFWLRTGSTHPYYIIQFDGPIHERPHRDRLLCGANGTRGWGDHRPAAPVVSGEQTQGRAG